MQTKIKVVLQVLVIVLYMLRNPRLLFVNAASYNYQDQDVVLLLPEEREEASMMTVVKPFDVGLWCTIAGSFIYAVSVTWLLEQRISDQSSTEVFAHICSKASDMSLSSFNIQNRLARIVISVWLLVVSVLAISYTTNYIVMLNVQKVNVNEIIASDGAIGYLKHHFSPSYQDWSENLKAYTTEEECAKALSRGPNRGGVGVILMDRLDALHFIYRRHGYKYYDIPPEADTPRSLGVLDFMVWFIITGTASTLGLIKFIFDLLYSWMHRPTALSERVPPSDLQEIVTDQSEMVTQSDSPETSSVRLLAPVTDTSEMVTQSDSQETSLVRRLAPVTDPSEKKIVVLAIGDGRSKEEALKSIATVQGVDSVTMYTNENKIAVTGDVDPVSLTYKLRTRGRGFAELLSVKLAKEE